MSPLASVVLVGVVIALARPASAAESLSFDAGAGWRGIAQSAGGAAAPDWCSVLPRTSTPPALFFIGSQAGRVMILQNPAWALAQGATMFVDVKIDSWRRRMLVPAHSDGGGLPVDDEFLAPCAAGTRSNSRSPRAVRGFPWPAVPMHSTA